MRTKYNSFTSDLKLLVCGVPQGSVVGPILFLCYVNDIVNIAHDSNTQVVLYADYTVIYCHSNDMLDLQTKLQTALRNVSVWCEHNRINLNISKSKPCCYGTRDSLNTCHLELKLVNNVLN